MILKKTTIKLDNDAIVEAQVPPIISASRSTDIPAFYSDWFFHTLHGLIHSMERKAMYLIKIHVL